MKQKHWIEHIVWEDHSGGTAGWTEVENIQKEVNDEYFIHTVGMVIAENSKRLTLVQNLAKNMMADHHMTILKNNILKRKKLAFITERVK
jgi:hypothetical protein